MAFVLNDRVKETTTSTGTGTIQLAGAATGFETFVAGIGNSNECYYCIQEQGGTHFEVGRGTVTDGSPDTLSRVEVFSSSNSDSLVDFSAGTKDVFCTLPASKAVVEDASNNVAIGGTVDGRDLQTDGTKLDGIEASADVTDSANVGTALTGFPTGTDAAASDLVPYYDVDAGAWEKSTVTNLSLQGPTGPTGPAGPTGPTGPTGSSGTGTGTADKIFENDTSVECVDTGTGVVEVKVDGTETITVTKGEVCINVTDPKATLDVARTSDNYPAINVSGGNNTYGDFTVESGEILQTGHWNRSTSTFTERFRIGSQGALGIAGSNYRSSGQVLSSQG